MNTSLLVGAGGGGAPSTWVTQQNRKGKLKGAWVGPCAYGPVPCPFSALPHHPSHLIIQGQEE
jgi:hypothetical protein